MILLCSVGRQYRPWRTALVRAVDVHNTSMIIYSFISHLILTAANEYNSTEPQIVLQIRAHFAQCERNSPRWFPKQCEAMKQHNTNHLFTVLISFKQTRRYHFCCVEYECRIADTETIRTSEAFPVMRVDVEQGFTNFKARMSKFRSFTTRFHQSKTSRFAFPSIENNTNYTKYRTQWYPAF